VALIFVDLDATHKYHDFGGFQGYCLVLLKSFLYLYFLYCVKDSKKIANK